MRQCKNIAEEFRSLPRVQQRHTHTQTTDRRQTDGSCHKPNVINIKLDEIWHKPSVCRLSVTLLHPIHRVELFGNIFAPSNSLGAGAVCLKSRGKFVAFWVIVEVKWKRGMKIGAFDPYLALFRNRYKIRA